MSDKEIFIVESGEYSDYQVHFATPDKVLAGRFCDAINGGRSSDDYDGYRVDTLPVYDADPDVWQELRASTSITPGHPPRRDRDYIYREFGRKTSLNAAQTEVRGPFPTGVAVWVVTTGWDHERVQKSHSERVALEYAKQQGVA